MTLLRDQHWYCSEAALVKARKLKLAGKPHVTPDGQAVLVCDFLGAGLVAMVQQGADGHDLMTRDGQRVAFDPSALPDLDRLIEFDHLPEARKATSWMKPGSKLALLFVILLACAGQAFAGLSASTAWEVRTTGSDTANSGGFRYGAAIAAPAAPTVTPSAGGAVAAATYYCLITYSDGLGETVISAETPVTTTAGTQTITVTSPGASTGALSWSCYFGTTSGGPYFPQGTTLAIGGNRVITATPPTTGTQPRGVDYSQQDAPQISVTNAVANGTTTVTSATAGFTGSHVGNVAKINGAFYDIVGVTSATAIVVDRTITTGSSLALIVGGGLASPGAAQAAGAVNPHIAYVRNGAYTIANGTVNTAGNKISSTAHWVGYATNRYFGNTDTSPTWDAAANSEAVCTLSGSNQIFDNIAFTNTGSFTPVTAMTANGQGLVRHCSWTSLSVPIAFGSNAMKFVDCLFTSCGPFGTFGSGHQFSRCVAVTSTGASFSGATDYVFDECIAISAGTIGFVVGQGIAKNCIAYSSGSHGFQLNSACAQAFNCISYGAAGSGNGFQVSAAAIGISLYNCAAGSNGGVNFDANLTSHENINSVTLTTSPFTNAAGGDFSLNDTAGGGKLCRGAGIPGSFAGISTTGSRDIGAAQHADSAGGGFRPRPRTSFKPGAPGPHLILPATYKNKKAS